MGADQVGLGRICLDKAALWTGDFKVDSNPRGRTLLPLGITDLIGILLIGEGLELVSEGKESFSAACHDLDQSARKLVAGWSADPGSAKTFHNDGSMAPAADEAVERHFKRRVEGVSDPFREVHPNLGCAEALHKTI